MKWFIEDSTNHIPVNNVLTGYGDKNLVPMFFTTMTVAYKVCSDLNKKFNCIGQFYNVVCTD